MTSNIFLNIQNIFQNTGDGIKSSGSGVSSDGYFGENLLVPGVNGSQRIHRWNHKQNILLMILLNYFILSLS